MPIVCCLLVLAKVWSSLSQTETTDYRQTRRVTQNGMMAFTTI